MKNYPYLKDSSFLKEFDRIRNKEQFAKITLLDANEEPIQSIEGKIIGGSLNIDGTSAIRRTCNISMVATEAENDLSNIDNLLLYINNKIELEIGFKNRTEKYKDFPIIWFPQGIFVIIAPSISHALDGVNISLQLKDKMCLLNGECGGVLPASTVFHEYETIDDDGKYIIIHPTIYQIIKELVNHFGGESLDKIIISDLDTRIKKVMKWTGNTPLYITTNADGGIVQHIATTSGDEAAAADSYKIYEYGDDIGYIYTDFVFPGELIGDAGNSVCDILEKIKNVLGNFEYFYDINGNFVFQEIKNYLNTTQAKVDLKNLDKDGYLLDMSKGKSVYTFDDGVLATSYSNAPLFNMIKNDFVVWGMRENANGNTVPIRFHLAIDKKPKIENTYEVFFYKDPEDGIEKAKAAMSFPTLKDFPKIGVQDLFYHDKSSNIIYKWDPSSKGYLAVELGFESITTKDWRTELYLQGTIAEPLGREYNYYYTELKNEWTKIYNIKDGNFDEHIIKYPSDIDFFLDIIDTGSVLADFNVSSIGRRSKVVIDDSVNCIFEPEIPDFILIKIDSEDTEKLRLECEKAGQEYIQIDPRIYDLIAGGGKANSAYQLIRELLYQHTSYNSNITVTAIPIFHLEPNTRITVRDTESGIYGDFMINNISIPLDTTGTMTVSCVQALERI